MISNGVALLVFYLMYKWGASNIQGVKEYYYIPLIILLVNLAISDYKEIKTAEV
jgi:uncharacterized membrane protein